MKALEIGLAPWAQDETGSTATLEPLVRQCERAEALGYHSIWFPESHFSGSGATPAPLLLLAAVAARTQRVRLGTTSYLLPIRHPLHVAAEVAVLDRLSRGRVILGVGRGFRADMFAAFQVARKQKRDLFEQSLDVMKRAWAGEPVAASEDAEPVTLAPLPVQKPYPPIWVAAFGPKALAQAGRLALPYLASPMEPRERLARNYALHREACPTQEAAARLAVPVMRTIFVTHDRAAHQRVHTGLARQMQATAAARSGLLDGPPEVDEVALIGPPEQVAAGIARYRDELGVTHLIARAHVPGASEAEIEASLELLAELGQDDRQ